MHTNKRDWREVKDKEEHWEGRSCADNVSYTKQIFLKIITVNVALHILFNDVPKKNHIWYDTMA